MIGKIAKAVLGAGLLAPALFPASAGARPALIPEQEALIGRCIREAASGREWLERTLWGLRDQEAGWVGAEVPNTNGTHDLGPMQINTWWIPSLSALIHKPPETVRAWLIQDACFNVQIARWIFLTELSANRDYWRAIGAYHSPTDWRRRDYALSVSKKLRARFGSN